MSEGKREYEFVFSDLMKIGKFKRYFAKVKKFFPTKKR